MCGAALKTDTDWKVKGDAALFLVVFCFVVIIIIIWAPAQCLASGPFVLVQPDLGPNDIQLTDEQRKLLAKRAKETGKPASELLEEMFGATAQRPRVPKGDRSLIDALRERGLVGAMQGPGDLSTNPKHMEGFGESRGGKDSD